MPDLFRTQDNVVEMYKDFMDDDATAMFIYRRNHDGSMGDLIKRYVDLESDGVLDTVDGKSFPSLSRERQILEQERFDKWIEYLNAEVRARRFRASR